MFLPSQGTLNGISLTVQSFTDADGLIRRLRALQPPREWTRRIWNTVTRSITHSASREGSIILTAHTAAIRLAAAPATYAQALFAPIAAANVWAEI